MSTPPQPEIYVSTDIETDGPIPGPNSMLSFASAAFLADKTLVSTFTANLEALPEANGDPDTMKWWEGQPEAWNAHSQTRFRRSKQSNASLFRLDKIIVWKTSFCGISSRIRFPVCVLVSYSIHR